MIDPELTRSLLLLIPLGTSAALLAWRRPSVREAAGALLAFLWLLPTLLGLNLVAVAQGWWFFNLQRSVMLGIPVDILLGWAFAWGPVAFLAFPKTNLLLISLVVLWLDLALMPQLSPLLALGPDWLLGEGLALLICLVPAQLLARWTAKDQRLFGRVTLQALCFGGLFLFFLPTIILEQTGANWAPVLNSPSWLVGLAIQGIAVPVVVGLSAVQEFAQRGGGTPIPFDPPKLLVTSGPYAYVANPMQLSTMFIWLGLGFWLQSVWVAAAGSLMTVVFGSGLGDWQEKKDLPNRLGPGWVVYRKEVCNWWPRWRPYVPISARLYVAEGCGVCEEVARWIVSRNPVGIMIIAAQDHPERDLERITYAPGEGGPEEDGVAALARALEHVNLAWAWSGWAIRLPLIRQAMQLLVDAVGEKPMKRCLRR